jgi:hypothetical protein
VAKPTDQDKLRILLPHWVEHNAEHAGEFRQWATRAGAAREYMEAAADALERANEALQSALASLGGAE